MNRRNFLALTAASVAALAIDPERLLWQPGKRAYFDLWTPPKLTVGDWVVFKGNDGGWKTIIDLKGGNQWVLCPSNAIERITPSSLGRVGIVTSAKVRGEAAVQVYGQAGAVMLANPFVDGAGAVRFATASA